MGSWNLQVPIVFIIYKRPVQTLRVFRAIRESKPAKLFVIADGPKNEDDVQNCSKTRRIIDSIDWKCTVYKDFTENNMGLRKRIISGLDWVFNQVENAIILEDDCLPHPSFFRYCEELLNNYQNDKKVMHISGDNFLSDPNAIKESYYFSRYAHVWGWATWRRAWENFHKWDLSNPPLDPDILPSEPEKRFWLKVLKEINAQKLEYTWDYQWAIVCLAFKSLCIMPNVNLVTNIGFGEGATNTKNKSRPLKLAASPMQFPLIQPKAMTWNDWADEQVARIFFYDKSTTRISKLKTFMKRIIPS